MMKGGGPIYDKFSQNFSYSLKYYYNLSVLVCFLKQVKRQAVNLWRPLETFERARGRPLLRYRDVCKRDMKALDIDIASWETTAADREGCLEANPKASASRRGKVDGRQLSLKSQPEEKQKQANIC